MIIGNLADDIGKVVEVEMIGDSFQDIKEACIRLAATKKLATTARVQKQRITLDLAPAM